MVCSKVLHLFIMLWPCQEQYLRYSAAMNMLFLVSVPWYTIRKPASSLSFLYLNESVVAVTMLPLSLRYDTRDRA